MVTLFLRLILECIYLSHKSSWHWGIDNSWRMKLWITSDLPATEQTGTFRDKETAPTLACLASTYFKVGLYLRIVWYHRSSLSIIFNVLTAVKFAKTEVYYRRISSWKCYASTLPRGPSTESLKISTHQSLRCHLHTLQRNSYRGLSASERDSKS